MNNMNPDASILVEGWGNSSRYSGSLGFLSQAVALFTGNENAQGRMFGGSGWFNCFGAWGAYHFWKGARMQIVSGVLGFEHSNLDSTS